MAGLASLTANYTDSEDEEKGQEDLDDNNKESPDFSGVSGPPSVVDRFRETAESRGNTPVSTRYSISIFLIFIDPSVRGISP
jgi:hypothetical protein